MSFSRRWKLQHCVWQLRFFRRGELQLPRTSAPWMGFSAEAAVLRSASPAPLPLWWHGTPWSALSTRGPSPRARLPGARRLQRVRRSALASLLLAVACCAPFVTPSAASDRSNISMAETPEQSSYWAPLAPTEVFWRDHIDPSTYPITYVAHVMAESLSNDNGRGD